MIKKVHEVYRADPSLEVMAVESDPQFTNRGEMYLKLNSKKLYDQSAEEKEVDINTEIQLCNIKIKNEGSTENVALQLEVGIAGSQVSTYQTVYWFYKEPLPAGEIWEPTLPKHKLANFGFTAGDKVRHRLSIYRHITYPGYGVYTWNGHAWFRDLNLTHACVTECEVTCQTGCEVGCEDVCKIACESLCEAGCETPCQLACQTGCEVSCQDACELTCQDTCEVTCQDTCEVSCENGCEDGICQTACEVSCETACEAIAQVPGIPCPIAVVTTGTELVDFLGPIREFRDNYLKATKTGKAFISLYYNNITPKLSPFLKKHEPARKAGRMVVKSILKWLKWRKK